MCRVLEWLCHLFLNLKGEVTDYTLEKVGQTEFNEDSQTISSHPELSRKICQSSECLRWSNKIFKKLASNHSRNSHIICLLVASDLLPYLMAPSNLCRKNVPDRVTSPLLASRLEEERLGTVRYKTTAEDEFLLEDSVTDCSALWQGGLLPILYGRTAFSTRSFISSADVLSEKPNPR